MSMRIVNVSMRDCDISALDALAKRGGCSRAEVVRRLVLAPGAEVLRSLDASNAKELIDDVEISIRQKAEAEAVRERLTREGADWLPKASKAVREAWFAGRLKGVHALALVCAVPVAEQGRPLAMWVWAVSAAGRRVLGRGGRTGVEVREAWERVGGWKVGKG